MLSVVASARFFDIPVPLAGIGIACFEAFDKFAPVEPATKPLNCDEIVLRVGLQRQRPFHQVRVLLTELLDLGLGHAGTEEAAALRRVEAFRADNLNAFLAVPAPFHQGIPIIVLVMDVSLSAARLARIVADDLENLRPTRLDGLYY